jgi:phosphatidylserine synthase
VSDSVTFGIAPGVLVAFHPEQLALWAPWATASAAVGILVAALALARLVYFTLRGYQHKDFVGAPTPQNALGVIVVLLFLDVPAYAGTNPPLSLLLITVLALLMVAPVPFPKVRRGAAIRLPATVTALALVLAILPAQFAPSVGSPLYVFAEASAVVSAAGVAIYYVVGPFTVPKESGTTPTPDA